MLLHLFIALTALNLFQLQATSENSLLKMGQNFDCIKQAIDDFIKKQSCQAMTESQKTLLAIQMTNCLNLKMGKATIPQCDDLKKCKIQGDDWNTFTSFFTHIDNLCHFYWDLLHHQRTEKLVESLSESAIVAQKVLKDNYRSTQKILSTQSQIQLFMKESLASNRQLSESLNISQKKLQNMTQNIEVFLSELNQKIIVQYSSISKIMQTISQGIDGLSNIQSFMMSEINSMSGIIYFCLKILVFFILTSFEPFRRSRMQGFFILLTHILVESVAPCSIILLIGITSIRRFFMLAIIVTLIRSVLLKENELQRLQNLMDGRLETRRIKRIFKQLMDQNKLSLPQEKTN